MVSARGAVVSAIAQSDAPTGFAFESGCQLRVKIIPPGAMRPSNTDPGTSTNERTRK